MRFHVETMPGVLSGLCGTFPADCVIGLRGMPVGVLRSRFGGALVSTWAGRPSRRESKRRTVRFAQLVAADDTKLREAAREAGVDAGRALDLLSDEGFCTLVRTIAEAPPQAIAA